MGSRHQAAFGRSNDCVGNLLRAGTNSDEANDLFPLARSRQIAEPAVTHAIQFPNGADSEANVDRKERQRSPPESASRLFHWLRLLQIGRMMSTRLQEAVASVVPGRSTRAT